jgi:hypothetical protein
MADGPVRPPSDPAPAIVPGDDRARHRHHQGRADPGALERFGERFSDRVLTEGAALRARPTGDASPAGGRPRRPSPRSSGLGVRGIGWREIEIERLPTGSRRSGSTGGRPPARSSWAWAGSRSRSATSRTTRWRSRSACGRPGGGTSSRPTSTSGSTSASGLLSRIERLRAPRTRGGGMVPLTQAAPVVAVMAADRPSPAGGDRTRRRRVAWPASAGATAPGAQGLVRQLLVVAGSLDYAGAALLVCRAAGRAGAGLVTLAVPESLQPLFAAKVVEATTMALPEDDLEEVDPEPALARSSTTSTMRSCGTGTPPRARDADLVRLLLAVPEDAVPPRRPRRRGAPVARRGSTAGGRVTASGPHAPRRRVRPAARRQRATTRPRTATCRRRRRPGGRRTPRRRDVGAGGRAQGRPNGRRGSGRERGGRPVREPGARLRRHRRRARRGDRGAARPGAGSVRRSASRRLPPRARRRAGPGAARRRRPPRRPTCRTGLPIARRRLAAIAERRRGSNRLGFGVREAGTGEA